MTAHARGAERIVENVSARRSAMLADELELYAEQTAEEVDQACSEIMALLRTLYERGYITTYFGSIRGAETAEAIEDDEDEVEGEEGEAHETAEVPNRTPAGGRGFLAAAVVAALAVLLMLAG